MSRCPSSGLSCLLPDGKTLASGDTLWVVYRARAPRACWSGPRTDRAEQLRDPPRLWELLLVFVQHPIGDKSDGDALLMLRNGEDHRSVAVDLLLRKGVEISAGVDQLIVTLVFRSTLSMSTRWLGG